jgi:hypothetical protein
MKKSIKNVAKSFTYNEFINYVETTKRHKDSYSHTSSDNTNEWGGVKSFKEAVDLCNNGWDAGIDQMAVEDSFTAQKYIKRRPAMVGGSVNIGRYVQGTPDCMNEFSSDVKYARPRITIVVPLVYGAFVSEEKAMKFSLEVLKLVNSYQSTNDVRLIGVLSSSHDSDKPVAVIDGQKYTEDFVEVIIKDFGERFVLNSMACVFHPCFFRRLYFKYIETTNYVNYGYGSSVYGSTWETQVGEMYLRCGHKVLALQSLNDERQRGTYREECNFTLNEEI